MNAAAIETAQCRQANDATVAVLEVALGVRPAAATPRRRKADAVQAAAAAEMACLTPIQREVLIHAACGLNNQQTAEVMRRTETSIRGQRKGIVSKLDRNLYACVVLAALAGWV